MKLQIKVIPSSSRDCIAGWLENTLKVRVKAPPEKGKANKAVVQLLEKALDLPGGSVKLVSGETSCHKIIEIITDNEKIVKQLLISY